jgi:hypothetical protein
MGLDVSHDFNINGRTSSFAINSPKHGLKEIIIDTEDIHLVKNYTWRLKYCKNINNFYVVSNVYINNKLTTIHLHRLVTSCLDNMVVDHKDHDTFNNCKDNLRVCTNKQNQENRIKANSNSKSGVKGVCWCKKSNRWRATINHFNKQIYLGIFSDIKEAEKAVIDANNKYFTHNN